MSEERQLILHLGSHKTGSTSISHALYAVRDQLKSCGFNLFNRNLDGSERRVGNALPWVGHQQNGVIGGAPHPEFVPRLAEVPGTVICSVEHLSWIFDPEIISSLRQGLAEHFNSIKLIVYLRRQDRQAISHYQQGSKYNGQPAFFYYDGSASALPEYKPRFQQYLNYHEKIGLWGDVFGDDNLAVRVFDREQLKDGDVVQDFFSIAGLPVKVEPGLFRKNKSDGFERTKVGHLMAKAELTPSLHQRLGECLDNTGKMLPARKDAQAFYAHFRESNRRLNQRFNVNDIPCLFSDDFSMYPEEAQDQWNEETANQAILHLLNGLNALPVVGDHDLAHLKRAANALVDSDMDCARSLEAMISRIDPEFSLALEAEAEPALPETRSPDRYLRRIRDRLFGSRQT
jgi:hypothetical protein